MGRIRLSTRSNTIRLHKNPTYRAGAVIPTRRDLIDTVRVISLSFFFRRLWSMKIYVCIANNSLKERWISWYMGGICLHHTLVSSVGCKFLFSNLISEWWVQKRLLYLQWPKNVNTFRTRRKSVLIYSVVFTIYCASLEFLDLYANPILVRYKLTLTQMVLVPNGIYSPQNQRMQGVVNGAILCVLWLVYYPSRKISTIIAITDFVAHNVSISETNSFVRMFWISICKMRVMCFSLEKTKFSNFFSIAYDINL